LDGLLLQTVVKVWEDLASMVLPAREAYHRVSPRIRAFALTASIREAIRRYWPVLLLDLARFSIDANEVAMWAYIDELLGPVRRGTRPLAALEQLWLTLKERIEAERAFELGYQVEPTQAPDELTRYVRRIVEREAWKHENRFGKRRRNHDELGAFDEEISKEARRAVARGAEPGGVWRPEADTVQLDEETVAGREVPVDQREVLIRARMEVVAKNDCERAYIAFLAAGFDKSEAAQRARLTPGKARAFGDRATRGIRI
jgi:hypothetical protein